MSSLFCPLRPSTIRQRLTWLMAPVLWACYLQWVLGPRLAAVTAAGWARLAGLIARMAVVGLAAPPIVVVSPVALELRTQTRRDGRRQVFEVVGLDATGCIRYAGTTEVLRTQTAPVYVFVRPLSVPLCSPELSP